MQHLASNTNGAATMCVRRIRGLDKIQVSTYPDDTNIRDKTLQLKNTWLEKRGPCRQAGTPGYCKNTITTKTELQGRNAHQLDFSNLHAVGSAGIPNGCEQDLVVLV